jgi:predicted patatin/cPLA2 family phospholipase
MKTGFVLEGGAMRGIYTAGVLDVFMDLGIKPDGIIGVSAGAIHGATFIAGQQGRSIRYMKKYCRDWHFMSWKSFFLTGDLVGKTFSYEELPYELDPFDFDTYYNSDIAFYAVATSLETGEAVYFNAKETRNEHRTLRMIRASASMPVISHIAGVDGKPYLDGGTADSIPIRAFREMGYDKNIVVLTQPDEYMKKPEKLMPMIRSKYRNYPAYIEASEKRHLVYNATKEYLKELEAAGEVFVFRPSDPVDISRMESNPKVIQAQYDLGRADALAEKEKLLAFLEK